VIVCDFQQNYFGIRVDEVLGIVSIPPDKIKPVPDSFGQETKKYVHGIAFHNPDKQELICILEIEKIFLSPKFDLVRGKK
jgi:chemotaxis signal transduction protein